MTDRNETNERNECLTFNGRIGRDNAQHIQSRTDEHKHTHTHNGERETKENLTSGMFCRKQNAK